MVSNIQGARELVASLRTEMNIQWQVTAKIFCPVGFTEGRPEVLSVATSVNQPESDGKVVSGCLNATDQTMKLSARSTIGTFTGVEANQVDEHLLGQEMKTL